MKTRIVLAGLMATMMVLEVSAQRAEYDDMYFRAKDRERNKSISAEEAFAPAKKQREVSAQEALDEDYYANPTDSYSSRNVNPEYVSRANSEQASDEEENYYSENYEPAPTTNFNNSYYNNANWARNSFYGNSMFGNPYYGGMGFYDPWMSPYGFGYDPWMSPMYGGMGPGYGWRSGWSLSIGYGNFWGPGYGFGNGFGYPYYGYGFGYPNYYYGGGGYYEGRGVAMGKRPSRHSAVVRPTQGLRNRQVADNSSTVNTRGRARQAQDEYYVRPSRRTQVFDNTNNPSRNSSRDYTPGTQPSRSREWSQPRESRPSYSPSPSRGSSGSSGGSRSSGSGGGGGSRPRGRG